MREVCRLFLTRYLPTLLDRKDRMSMALGLEVRVPYCDRRIVEYVFGTPWAHKTFDGREKSAEGCHRGLASAVGGAASEERVSDYTGCHL